MHKFEIESRKAALTHRNTLRSRQTSMSARYKQKRRSRDRHARWRIEADHAHIRDRRKQCSSYSSNNVIKASDIHVDTIQKEITIAIAMLGGGFKRTRTYSRQKGAKRSNPSNNAIEMIDMHVGIIQTKATIGNAMKGGVLQKKGIKLKLKDAKRL